MMQPEDEFEEHILSALDEPALVDETFTAAVTTRLTRHRRYRQLVLCGTVMTATAGVVIAMYLSQAPWIPSSALGPEAIVATLLLVGICSLVWIATEPSPRQAR
jgi:hypothetical protein